MIYQQKNVLFYHRASLEFFDYNITFTSLLYDIRNTSALCTVITVYTDNILEETESITLMLQSADGTATIEQSNQFFTVTILDSNSKLYIKRHKVSGHAYLPPFKFIFTM